MLTNSLFNLIKMIALDYGLDHTLVAAIVMIESSGNPCAIRYEPTWRYTYQVKHFANKLGYDEISEEAGQSMSWGAMQVMGTVAREHSFRGWFPELCNLSTGIDYGCRHLKAKFDKYIGFKDSISAYNQGSPRKDESGDYKNQKYVDKVLKVYKQIIRDQDELES